MTALKDKIQNALDESRMLVLGAEMLIGFEFTATFQEGFKQLSKTSQNLNLAALVLMLLTLAFLISPAAFHQLREKGRESADLHRYATRAMELALLPFALGVGASFYIPGEEIGGPATGLIFALALTGVALLFWYGPAMLRERSHKGNGMSAEDKQHSSSPTSVHDKIRHVLTEARVVLPGNQALLGFQLAIILQRGFRDLPQALKWVHLASLCFIAVSTVLLLTPAAYHRIVEQGEETEHFYRVANVLVIWSLPALAIGICGDFFLVVYKMTELWRESLVAAGVMFSFFAGMWFGYPLLRRKHLINLARRAA